jgi:hypothetical protein
MEHEQDLGGEMMVTQPVKKVPVVKKKADGSVKKTGKKYKQQQQLQQQEQPEKPESPQPSVAPKSLQKMTIQFDQITNHPIYPICIGFSDFDLTVYNLGRIIFDKPAYHTETAM